MPLQPNFIPLLTAWAREVPKKFKIKTTFISKKSFKQSNGSHIYSWRPEPTKSLLLGSVLGREDLLEDTVISFTE